MIVFKRLFKTNSPLSDCTKEEMRVITVLNTEGVKQGEIIHLIQQQYGGSCLSRRKINKWINHFKSGIISLYDECQPYRLPSLKGNDTIETVKQLILNNQHIAVGEIVSELNVSHCSAYSIIQNSIIFQNVFGQWV